MNENAKPAGTGRVNYIDSLRGLSMVLVVLAHVLALMSPDRFDPSPVGAVLMSFRMPLFFFVSGFFAYKALDRWTASVTVDIVVRKARAQLLCATVFFILWQLVHDSPVFAFITEGYSYFWFTIALFQMFMVYVALAWLSKWLHCDLVPLTLAVLAIASMFAGLTMFSGGVGVTLSWHQVLVYWQFFAAGLLARRYWSQVEWLLNCDWVRAVAVVVFVAGCFMYYGNGYHEPTTLGRYLTQGVLHRYAGLLTVLIFFYQRASYFDGNAAVARFLRFTGRRTLDIYMMHMFFVPHLFLLPCVSYLLLPDMGLIKLAIGIAVALAVVGICLLCSQLLRSSHFLAVWLFGVRNHPKAR